MHAIACPHRQTHLARYYLPSRNKPLSEGLRTIADVENLVETDYAPGTVVADLAWRVAPEP